MLDNNAEQTEEHIKRESQAGLNNVKRVFRLSKGNIEDYFPLEIVADVINQELSPTTPVSADDFDELKNGYERLQDFKKVMHEKGAGSSIGYLKRSLGLVGAKMFRDRGIPLDPELQVIFDEVKRIVDEQQ